MMTRIYLWLGTGLAFALLLAWGLRVDHLRAGYKDALTELRKQADTIVLALREATDNPKADWQTAPGQIVALGESQRRLKAAIGEQNAAIDDLAREAVRMKARQRELQAIADKAEAQRRSAYRKLSDMAITPGTRSDCLQLLREADEALTVVREAGL